MKKIFSKKKFTAVFKSTCALLSAIICVSPLSAVYAAGGTLDYSSFDAEDLSGYKSNLSGNLETKTTFELSNGVLKITTAGGEDATEHKPSITLGNAAIKTTDGPFSLSVTAKLYYSNAVVRNMFSLGDGSQTLNFGFGWCINQNIKGNELGLLLNANGRSDGMWTYKAEKAITDGGISGTLAEDARLNRTDNNVNITKDSDKYFLSLKDASESFYTYKWDIDPRTKTFKFYYKKQGEDEWTEPYASFNMINPYTAEEGDRFEEAGVFPTGTLPKNLTELSYIQRVIAGVTNVISISDISVEQKSLELEGGVEFENNSAAVLCFNSVLDTQALDEISVLKNGEKLEAGADYSVSPQEASSDKKVLFAFNNAAEEGDEFEFVISKDLNKKDNYAKPAGEIRVKHSFAYNIYVSALGNDSAAGTKANPVKTLERAVELFKARADKSSFPVVYILDDIALNNTIKLDKDCRGITFSAYGEKCVSVSAGYSGGEVSLAKSDDLGGRLPKEHIGRILKWDLSGCSDLAEDAERFDFAFYNPELSDNGEIKTLARWPDSGWAYTGKVTADKRVINSSGAEKDNYIGFEFKTTAPIKDYTLDNAKINGFWSWDYRLTKGEILGKGQAENTLELKVNFIAPSEYYFNPNRRYYLYNIPEEVNSPGEYYIDYDEKALYYYPNDINDYSLSLTGLKDGMFCLQEGCDNVSFFGLSLENTRGTAITGDGINGLSVDNCRIKNTGGRGIYVHGTYNTEIKNSFFGSCGDTAVELQGGDCVSLKPSNSKIFGCEFENGGRVVGTYCPFVQIGAIAGGELTNTKFYTAAGINVENNYFHDHMHSAIIFEGNDFVIKNNVFDRVVTQTQDAGAIYSRANPTYRGNKITNNIFKNIRTFKADETYAYVSAVYLDDLIPDVDISQNVFQNCSWAVFFGGGQQHSFVGNLVYDCFKGVDYYLRGNRASAAVSGGYLKSFIDNKKSAVEKAGLSMDLWYEKYQNYKAYEDMVNEYAVAVKNGEADVSNREDTRYGILHITGETIKDNIFISPNAANEISEFCNFYLSSKVDDLNVNAEHNYLSSDLSLAEVSEEGVSISEKVTALGYRAPDVSKAGILQKGAYIKKSGRETDAFKNPSKMFFTGSVFEEFEGYPSGSLAGLAREIQLSGGGKISNGCLELSAGESVDITLPHSPENSLSLEIKHSGELETTVCGTTITTQNEKSAVVTIICDFAANAAEVYKKTDGKNEKIQNIETDFSGYAEKITLTAKSDIKIDWIGFLSPADGTVGEGGISLDFEDEAEGTPAEMLSDRFFTYAPYGCFDLSVKKEADGNKTLCLSEWAYTSAQSTYAELIIPDVKAADNKVYVEFSVKASSDSSARLTGLFNPAGFNTDSPETDVMTNVLYEQSTDNKIVTYKDGTTVITADELKSGYTRLKYEIDKQNSVVKIFKKSSNGGWNAAAEISGRSIPDYINRLRVITNVPAESEAAEYYFDDIRVYTASAATDSAEGDAGEEENTFTFYPEYIPGLCGEEIALCVYDEKSGFLEACAFGEYVPHGKISVKLPKKDDDEEISDNGSEYVIKRFIFKDKDLLVPAAPAKTIKTQTQIKG